MKMIRRMTSLTLLLAGLLAVSGCIKKNDATTHFNDDGSVVITYDVVLIRGAVESALDQFDQMRQQFGAPDQSGSSTSKPADDAAKDTAKPDEKTDDKARQKAADAKLAARLRKMMTEDQPAMMNLPGVTMKIPTIDVDADTVRLVVKITAPDLKTYVQIVPQIMEQSGLSHITLTKTDAGKLQIKLESDPGTLAGREQAFRAQASQMSFTGMFKFEMPGKIVSSTMDTTKDDATYSTIDTNKAASIDHWAKMMHDGVTIVAEPGKVDLSSLPLDSADFAPAIGPMQTEPVAGDNLKITPAGPGYTAEAISVTTTTVHTYADGAKLLGQDQRMYFDASDRPGCVIHAKLYAPRGRHLLNLKSVEIKKAVDDKGRKIPGNTADDSRYDTSYMNSDMQDKHISLDMDLRLKEPAPGAQAIDSLEAEAIVTSFGKWQEMTLPDAKADPKKVIDLSKLVPGAKMKITSFSQQGGINGTYQIELTGPAEVQAFDFTVRVPGVDQVNCFNQRVNTEHEGDNVTITRMLNYTAFDRHGHAAQAKPQLIIRQPTDLKRERVPFKLQAIDLF